MKILKVLKKSAKGSFLNIFGKGMNCAGELIIHIITDKTKRPQLCAADCDELVGPPSLFS